MTRRRRALPSQAGFTLIELLVVIVILGILSAVVVFAVRGADDKGKGAADATDKRTLQTAQEAFCARFGRYAENEAQLVDPSLADPSFGTKGFLSEESETHDIVPAGEGDPKPCNGTGYRIIGGSAPTPPDPGASPGTFTDLPDPPFATEALVPLANGKVLAWGYNAASLVEYAQYDPAAPAASAWTAADPPPGSFESYRLLDYVVLLDDPATPLSECVPNCGKVLGKGFAQPWLLYNPDAPRGAQWEPVPGSAGSESGNSYWINAAVLLTDDPTTPAAECGLDCGKVFITTKAALIPETPRLAELYDPHNSSLTPISYPSGQERTVASAGILATLRDGRVLMVGPDVTKLFDPVTRTFSDADQSSKHWPNTTFEPPPPILANGDVLLGRIDKQKEIYRPVRGGKGQWVQVDNCGEPGQFCEVLASLSDGTAFAHTRTATSPNPSTGKTFLLQMKDGRWTWRSAATTLKPTSGGAGALLDPRFGRCNPTNCGKVLVAGSTAQLYQPPGP